MAPPFIPRIPQLLVTSLPLNGSSSSPLRLLGPLRQPGGPVGLFMPCAKYLGRSVRLARRSIFLPAMTFMHTLAWESVSSPHFYASVMIHHLACSYSRNLWSEGLAPMYHQRRLYNALYRSSQGDTIGYNL
ncbi:hypothetical protein NMY22_g5431 [Coprinellus aureogranulatus]|nr:hypothetical protein NMY22_g5431 [Coprinellus aureogranulatus]